MRPVAALFAFTVWQTLLSRKVRLTLLLLLAPALLLVTIRGFAEPMERVRELWMRYHVTVQFLFVMVVLPLVCMTHGVGLIGSEVEGHTWVHLITRRMRRGTVLLVKFAATAVVLAVLCELTLLALHLSAFAGVDTKALVAVSPSYANWAPGHDLVRYVMIIPAAVVGFLAVFTLIGLLTAQPLALSVFYLIAVELIMGNVPAGTRFYTLLHPLRQAMVRLIPDLAPLYHENEMSAELFARLFPEGATGVPQLLGVVLVALALSTLLASVRELLPAKVVRE